MVGGQVKTHVGDGKGDSGLRPHLSGGWGCLLAAVHEGAVLPGVAMQVTEQRHLHLCQLTSANKAAGCRFAGAKNC